MSAYLGRIVGVKVLEISKSLNSSFSIISKKSQPSTSPEQTYLSSNSSFPLKLNFTEKETSMNKIKSR